MINDPHLNTKDRSIHIDLKVTSVRIADTPYDHGLIYA